MPAKENSRLVLEDATPIGGKTRTEIDLKDRVIRKTWRLLRLSRSRTYEIGNHAVVEIQDNSTMLEGYNIASFGVYLTGRSGTIRIASTDDLKEAYLIRDATTEFLKESAGEGSHMTSS
jgi:hypothetical protein